MDLDDHQQGFTRLLHHTRTVTDHLWLPCISDTVTMD